MNAPLSERERLKLQVIGRAVLPLAEQRAELERKVEIRSGGLNQSARP